MKSRPKRVHSAVMSTPSPPASARSSILSSPPHSPSEFPPPVSPRPASPPSVAPSAASQKESPAKRVRILKSSVAEEDIAPERSGSAIRVGAHVSASGGVENAVKNAAKIGANAFALFLKSQRQWKSTALAETTIKESFPNACKKFSYNPKRDMLPHGSYLVNLANPESSKREKSYECFIDDIKRCESLGIGLYNFHPGSPMKEDRVRAIGWVAEGVNRALNETKHVTIVLENMAGQGEVLGSYFEDLRDIIKLVKDKSRIGVCIDTCHLFAASESNDIRTPLTLHQTLTRFDSMVPFRYWKALHVNDSKFGLGMKKDRHENIGVGQIGLEGFWSLIRWNGPEGKKDWEGWRDVLWILETPNNGNDQVWKREIELLHQLETLEDPSHLPTIQAEWIKECAGLKLLGNPPKVLKISKVKNAVTPKNPKKIKPEVKVEPRIKRNPRSKRTIKNLKESSEEEEGSSEDK
ncbi:Major apurinic/apyrimidinic endonuclease/3'-repair diesterase APN1 [Phaffia rhodozyma]|uniref:Apurinic-apyrimidinic endonuclease 1 n=1 Tax=Phaffia rhodozyma TaxID=264483 RepID=A0A0F7SP65_PHARH|nr:Major apurinic/apyrimidinic endonuclease/3'-repair diesterase APN1 [Phaffia rhodozyma]